MDPIRTDRLPTGAEYLAHASTMESDCEKFTDAQLVSMGKKAPECLAAFAKLLVRMDGAASCYWGCPGSDHQLEYVAGRLVSSARSSFTLLRRGFYDESFNLTRSMGEIANLLFLFAQDSPSLDRWTGLDARTRRREFSPVKVRLLIEAKGLPIPVDEESYSSLSEVATHIGPHTRPNSYFLGQRPKLGGYFDLASSMAALNELSRAFAVAGFSIAQVMELPKEIKLEVKECARDLLRSVGGVTLVALRNGELVAGNGDGSDTL